MPTAYCLLPTDFHVLPGIATPGPSHRRSHAKSSLAGPAVFFELIASSQVMVWPVYATSLPRMAIIELLAIHSPSFIGLPFRIEAKSSLCSVWYISFFSPLYSQLSRPESSSTGLPIAIRASPLLPNTSTVLRLAHPFCCRQK